MTEVQRLRPPRLDVAFALLALIWAGVIFYVNSLPQPDLPEMGFAIPHFDKFAHFCIYGLLAVLSYGAIAPLWRRPVLALPGLAVTGLIAVLGLIDELQQLLRPGRELDPMDWLANIAGALCGVVFTKVVWNWRRRQPW